MKKERDVEIRIKSKRWAIVKKEDINQFYINWKKECR